MDSCFNLSGVLSNLIPLIPNFKTSLMAVLVYHECNPVISSGVSLSFLYFRKVLMKELSQKRDSLLSTCEKC